MRNLLPIDKIFELMELNDKPKEMLSTPDIKNLLENKSLDSITLSYENIKFFSDRLKLNSVSKEMLNKIKDFSSKNNLDYKKVSDIYLYKQTKEIGKSPNQYIAAWNIICLTNGLYIEKQEELRGKGVFTSPELSDIVDKVANLLYKKYEKVDPTDKETKEFIKLIVDSFITTDSLGKLYQKTRSHYQK